MNERRFGDTIAIPGDYQHRALHEGRRPQRFWHAKRLDEAMRMLDPQGGDVIVDVGCGSGELAERISRTAGTRVIGVDANEGAIAFAQRTHRRENLTFRLGLVDELDFEDNRVDKIAFLEVLEHITRSQGVLALQGFHRVLRPGGRLVISTPNARSLWRVIEWLLDGFRLVPALAKEQHVALYSHGRLGTLAQETGFAVCQIRTIHTIAPWLAVVHTSIASVVHRAEGWLHHPFGCLLVAHLEKQA